MNFSNLRSSSQQHTHFLAYILFDNLQAPPPVPSAVCYGSFSVPHGVVVVAIFRRLADSTMLTGPFLPVSLSPGHKGATSHLNLKQQAIPAGLVDWTWTITSWVGTTRYVCNFLKVRRVPRSSSSVASPSSGEFSLAVKDKKAHT